MSLSRVFTILFILISAFIQAQNVGIATAAPLYRLDVDAVTGTTGNPARLLGLLAGSTADSIISSSSGILRRLSIAQIISSGAWTTTGNGGTTAGTNFVGTTDGQSLVFKTNSTEVMRMLSGGNIGIGTPTPVNKLDIEGGAVIGLTYAGTNTAPTNGLLIEGSLGIGATSFNQRVYIQNETANDYLDDLALSTFHSTSTPAFTYYRAKGTSAAPTTVGNSEYCGGFNGYVYNGSSYVSATGINTVTASDFATSNACDLVFATYRSGTTAERMRIAGTGNIGIGISVPTHILHINGQGRSTNSSWATSSDRRLKDIDGAFCYGLKELLQINTYCFHYKKDNPLKLPSDKPFQGVIAQELAEIIPEAVSKMTDGYLTVSTDPIFWTAINAIKELDA